MEEQTLNPATPSLPAVPAGWLAAFHWRGRLGYVLISLLLLLPVYWQPRVQGGDLSSHFDNAWLTQRIESGRMQGQAATNGATNILFDVLLSGLNRVGGAEFAQRMAVSLAVLTFVWGAFAFVTVVGGRRPWHLMSCIAMLAYGWVFHMGFYNFYLSLGLCFWALSVVWNPTPRRILAAALLLALGFLSQSLPVVWTLGLLAYAWLAGRVAARRRVYITAGWLLAMVLLHALSSGNVFSQWSVEQVAWTTGADQVWVFDGKYYFVLIGLLLVWGLLFIDLLRESGARYVVSGIPFQLCLIGASAVFILPTTVLLPGFQHALVYNAERMSLGVGICVCALLAAARPRAFEKYAMALVALVFFAFLYVDERALNSFQDRMSDTVAQLKHSRGVDHRPLWSAPRLANR